MRFKDKLSCTLGRVFGGCKQIGKQKKKAIMDAISHMNQIQQEWATDQIATNEKFFIVGKVLQDFRKAAEHLAEIRRSNVKILQTQFDTLASSIFYMRNCDQFFNIREEVNHHIRLLNSFLTSTYTNLHTYRSALFSNKFLALHCCYCRWYPATFPYTSYHLYLNFTRNLAKNSIH